MQTKLKIRDEIDAQPFRPAPKPIAEHQGAVAVAQSPARLLQDHVAEAWAERADSSSVRRWSPRATLLFSGGVSALLWAAIAACLGAFH